MFLKQLTFKTTNVNNYNSNKRKNYKIKLIKNLHGTNIYKLNFFNYNLFIKFSVFLIKVFELQYLPLSNVCYS